MKALAAFPILLLTAAAQTAGAPIEGLWKNPSGTAIIAIAPCQGGLCGKVAWASARGQREASKGAPQVVGTTVLTGLRPAHGRWTGTLYIPDDDVHVSAKLALLNAKRLKLTGCALMGLICRMQIWTRVDGPLPGQD